MIAIFIPEAFMKPVLFNSYFASQEKLAKELHFCKFFGQGKFLIMLRFQAPVNVKLPGIGPPEGSDLDAPDLPDVFGEFWWR